MFRQLHFAGLFNGWGGDLWSVQSVKSKKLLKLSKKGCTFGRKRDNFKIGIQSVIHLYGIFSGLNTKKQENQGFRKNGWFPFAPTRDKQKYRSWCGIFIYFGGTADSNDKILLSGSNLSLGFAQNAPNLRGIPDNLPVLALGKFTHCRPDQKIQTAHQERFFF